MKQLKKEIEQCKQPKKTLKNQQSHSLLAVEQIEFRKVTKIKKMTTTTTTTTTATGHSNPAPVNNLSKNNLQISVMYKKKSVCNFTVELENSNTSQLVEYCISIFRKRYPDINILGFQCGNSELDFYLACPKRPLDVFKKTLILNPFIESNEKGINKYKFLKVIGVGGFSKVYLARNRRDGKFYAIKLLEKKRVIQKRKTCILLNEKYILSSISHPFILKLYQSFQTHLFFCFVLQYCPGGELFYTLTQYKRFSEHQIKFYSVQILQAICYLHKLNILYRDLKPQNILLDIDGHIKLIDFGISRQNVTKDTVCTSFCGSPPYMAPQIVLKQGHSFPVDFYCIGALLYQLATGYPPFEGQTQKQVFYDIVHTQVQYPQSMTKSFKSLLKGLLHKNPKQRLGSKGGIDEILNHKFYQGINVKQILTKKAIPPIIPNIASLNVCVQNVVSQFIDLQKKLEIELQLQCNLYEKNLPNFEYSAWNPKDPHNQTTTTLTQSTRKGIAGIRKQNYEFSLEKYSKQDSNNDYFDRDYFDKQNSDLKKRKKQREQRMKSIKKEAVGNSNSKNINNSKQPKKNESQSLNRYNSLKSIKSTSKLKKSSSKKMIAVPSTSRDNNVHNNNTNNNISKKDIFQDYFETKKKNPANSNQGINSSKLPQSKSKPKQLIHQFSMTNISGKVYFG